MNLQNKLFINGEWVDALDGRLIDVFSPHDNSLITQVAEAKQQDVDRAVQVAVQMNGTFILVAK